MRNFTHPYFSPDRELHSYITVVEKTGYYQLSVWLLCDLDFYLCSGTNISFQFCNVGTQIERLIMLYECELLVAILEVLVYLLYLLVSKSLVL